jgi:hypothetical protein
MRNDAHGKGADSTDSRPYGVRGSEGSVRIDMDSKPKLAIIVAMVTALGARRLNPLDSFRKYAQTTSSSPATNRYIQAIARPSTKGRAVPDF